MKPIAIILLALLCVGFHQNTSDMSPLVGFRHNFTLNKEETKVLCLQWLHEQGFKTNNVHNFTVFNQEQRISFSFESMTNINNK